MRLINLLLLPSPITANSSLLKRAPDRWHLTAGSMKYLIRTSLLWDQLMTLLALPDVCFPCFVLLSIWASLGERCLQKAGSEALATDCHPWWNTCRVHFWPSLTAVQGPCWKTTLHRPLSESLRVWLINYYIKKKKKEIDNSAENEIKVGLEHRHRFGGSSWYEDIDEFSFYAHGEKTRNESEPGCCAFYVNKIHCVNKAVG